MPRQTLWMRNIIIIIVSLTVGYLERIFWKRSKITKIYINYPFETKIRACNGFRLLCTFVRGFSESQAYCLVSPALCAETHWVLSLHLPFCALRVALWVVKICLTPLALGAGFLESISLRFSLCAWRVVRWTVSSLRLWAKARWLESLS